MKQSYFLVLVAFALYFSFLQAEEKGKVTHVDATAAAKLVEEKKVTVLDVRTVDEFKGGHIDGALNHDFTEDSFRSEIQQLDKTQPYLVHCASGARSGRSLKIFKELGFEQVYHLDGGIKAWQEAGLPLKK